MNGVFASIKCILSRLAGLAIVNNADILPLFRAWTIHRLSQLVRAARMIHRIYRSVSSARINPPEIFSGVCSGVPRLPKLLTQAGVPVRHAFSVTWVVPPYTKFIPVTRVVPPITWSMSGIKIVDRDDPGRVYIYLISIPIDVSPGIPP
ncbi:MAG: hypothetical protein JZU63_10750, partial [Rhodoferax sp.]|nr:hypothetical protein [Rhodoferax sp.]